MLFMAWPSFIGVQKPTPYNHIKMIAQKNDFHEPPAKPMMKPLSDIEIQDDFCLDTTTPSLLPHIWNSKAEQLSEMETEESQCGDEDSAPQPRKRPLQELFSTSIAKRCMMSKLERMDRAPTKRRHY